MLSRTMKTIICKHFLQEWKYIDKEKEVIRKTIADLESSSDDSDKD